MLQAVLTVITVCVHTTVSSLTSLIGREGVLSGWYGRSMLCRLFHHDILCNPTCCPTLATSSKKPCASPCTLNMSPLDQHMVRKLSSAAAQGTACRDEPESVRRKQAFRPEQGRAVWQPKDTLHTYEWHICRKVQAPASQGYACPGETQSVGIDVRAASFHSDLCKEHQSPAAWPAECSQTGCVCMEGHACCRWKGSKGSKRMGSNTGCLAPLCGLCINTTTLKVPGRSLSRVLVVPNPG